MIDCSKHIKMLIKIGATLLLTSCTSTFTLHIQSDVTAALSYDTTFGPAVMETIQALTQHVSGQTNSPFDTAEFVEQCTALGFRDVVVRTPTAARLVITAKSTSADDIIHRSGMLQPAPRDSKTVLCTLSPETLSQIYAALPETARAYIDVFIAPVFTGDNMSHEEYLALVASVYGQALADEIAAAVVTLTLSAEGAHPAQKITLPLTDILLLQAPQTYTLRW
ncbi:MAG: hypothetical protein IJ191_01555 [Treponema sp.]|nr:hypothetical protein [Treponema sp.]